MRIATLLLAVAGLLGALLHQRRTCRDLQAELDRLAHEVAAHIIATSKGDRGTGRDYLANTVRHLDELGIVDTALHRIEKLVRAGAVAG